MRSALVVTRPNPAAVILDVFLYTVALEKYCAPPIHLSLSLYASTSPENREPEGNVSQAGRQQTRTTGAVDTAR